MKNIFGTTYQNDIWTRITQINDMDPDEVAEQALALDKEVRQNIASSLAPQSIASQTVNRVHMESGSDGVHIDMEPHFDGMHVPSEEAEYLHKLFGVIAAGFHIYNVQCLVC